MQGHQPPTAGLQHRSGHADLAETNRALFILAIIRTLQLRIEQHERNWAPTLWAVTLLAAVTSAWGMREILGSGFDAWMIAAGIALGITLIFPALWTAISRSIENLGPFSSVLIVVLGALTLGAQLAISTLTTTFLFVAEPIGEVNADRLANRMGVHLEDSRQVLLDLQTGLDRLQQRKGYFEALAITEGDTGTTPAGGDCRARCISLTLASQLFDGPINTFSQKIDSYTDLKAEADALLVALDALEFTDPEFLNLSQDLQRQIAGKLNSINALDVRGAYSSAADQISQSVPIPPGISRSAQLFIEDVQNRLERFSTEFEDAGDATTPVSLPTIERQSSIMNVINSLHEFPHMLAVAMLFDLFGVLMLLSKIAAVMRLGELRRQYQDLQAIEDIHGNWSEQGDAFAPNLTAEQLIRSAQTLAVLQGLENDTPVPPQPQSSQSNGEFH